MGNLWSSFLRGLKREAKESLLGEGLFDLVKEYSKVEADDVKMFDGIKSFRKGTPPEMVFVVFDLDEEAFVDEFVMPQLNSRREDHMTIGMKGVDAAVDVHGTQPHGPKEGSKSRWKI